MMAELFKTTVTNISMHIRNIYAEGELSPGATVKKFLTVRREGNGSVQRGLDFYNLDMIISVGYRVKSLIATRFRVSAFANDVAKTNLAAILEQAGIQNVRSL